MIADTQRSSVLLPCGMTVLVEPMPWLRTAAFSLSLYGGIQSESGASGGLSSLVCEMVQRGAGRYSSRDLVAVQDNLGMERHSSITTSMVTFTGAMPAESLREAIQIYADVVRRPHLPADQLDDAKQMAYQELRAIEDDPTQRVMNRVRQLQYGEALGRTPYGTMESIEAITSENVREFYETYYHGRGGILSVAGRVNPDEVIELAEDVFRDWKQGPVVEQGLPTSQAAYEHIEVPSSQTHIALSFDSLPFGHPDYFHRRAAVGVLSDGMSSRLFDRVREKRGLCYTIGANCHSLRHGGGVFVYAGTTPERAQETLDVTVREIEGFVNDLEPAELERWKVRVESNLVMEQESSSSRASSIAADQFQLGRVMELEEIESAIAAVSIDSIRENWQDMPPSDYRIVTLGPSPLQVPQVSLEKTFNA